MEKRGRPGDLLNDVQSSSVTAAPVAVASFLAGKCICFRSVDSFTNNQLSSVGIRIYRQV